MDKKVRVGIEGWLLLLIVGLWSQLLTAQSPLPKKDIPTIAKAANGSIVSIVMSDKSGEPLAQGSGFLVSKDGLIVTNYHVIAQGSSAVVKFPDGAFYVVDGVVASDKARDVAVIKGHGMNFHTLTLGNSDRLQIGEEVVAIGNPLSLESTVSNGIVSGIRTDEKLGGKFLQITTPISPGSSGGPLFNMTGEVVGITTMYLQGGENLNFAVPINDAKHLLVANSSKLQSFPNQPGQNAQTNGGNTPSAGPHRKKPTVAEIFDLTTRCIDLAEKMAPDVLFGRAYLVNWTSHYNPETNRCYVKVTARKIDSGVDSISLYDVQTELLLVYVNKWREPTGAMSTHAEISYTISPTGNYSYAGRQITFKQAEAEIDKLLLRALNW